MYELPPPCAYEAEQNAWLNSMAADIVAADEAAPDRDEITHDEQAWLDEQIHTVDMGNIEAQLCSASVRSRRA